VRKGGKKNQCGKWKKYDHNTRTCTVRKRHDEIQECRRSFYIEHAADTDCNLDMVSCAFFFAYFTLVIQLYVIIFCCLLCCSFVFVVRWLL
jgi:hypothetical protein